jgi:hypothetical protein
VLDTASDTTSSQEILREGSPIALDSSNVSVDVALEVKQSAKGSAMSERDLRSEAGQLLDLFGELAASGRQDEAQRVWQDYELRMRSLISRELDRERIGAPLPSSVRSPLTSTSVSPRPKMD